MQVDISGLQRATVAMVQTGPRWVDGVVFAIDEEGRRVTVQLQYPLDGKKQLRVALSRVKSE